jgi:NAD(P)-dependent dehydrogenase (short-subunit alcohol dehydrogenase family)
MTERIVLITGASRGLGRAVARGFALQGARLVLVARKIDNLVSVAEACLADGVPVQTFPCDLSSAEAIGDLCTRLNSILPCLDVLVGNAAVLGPQGSLSTIDISAWQEVFAVNVLANARLVQGLWPLLARSNAARIVFVTSGAARGVAGTGAYSVTKAGLNAMALGLAPECVPPQMTVNVVSPGPMRTDMRREAKPSENPETVPVPDEAVAAILDLARADCERHGEIMMLSAGRPEEASRPGKTLGDNQGETARQTG